MYRHTGDRISKKKETKHNEVIVDFLKTHKKATAVDIAERPYSKIHMSVGEVQLYLGELIDKKQIAMDKQDYHTWRI